MSQSTWALFDYLSITLPIIVNTASLKNGWPKRSNIFYRLIKLKNFRRLFRFRKCWVTIRDSMNCVVGVNLQNHFNLTSNYTAWTQLIWMNIDVLIAYEKSRKKHHVNNSENKLIWILFFYCLVMITKLPKQQNTEKTNVIADSILYSRDMRIVKLFAPYDWNSNLNFARKIELEEMMERWIKKNVR